MLHASIAPKLAKSTNPQASQWVSLELEIQSGVYFRTRAYKSRRLHMSLGVGGANSQEP